MSSVNKLIINKDEKLWSKLSLWSQSCNIYKYRSTVWCFKYYSGAFNKTQDIRRKENNPLPSKEDKWITRNYYG